MVSPVLMPHGPEEAACEAFQIPSCVRSLGETDRPEDRSTTAPEHWDETRQLPAAPVGAGPEREKLYAEFQPLVQRLIRQYGENAELRQDLAGEIYCRFCNLLDAYDPARGIPLRPYLVRMLSASVYTYTRSHWRLQQREIFVEAEVAETDAAHSVDPTHQWDHELMTQDVLKALPEAIAQLPLRQRQVVIWRYYEGRSFEEIAEMLDIRPATARSLLRHGLNNLRRQMASAHLVNE